jgi:hypothetical protein
MRGLAFFDTNVSVYADDVSSPEKRDRAIALFAEHLRRGTAVVSLQVTGVLRSGNAQALAGAGDGTAEGRDHGSRQSRPLWHEARSMFRAITRYT